MTEQRQVIEWPEEVETFQQAQAVFLGLVPLENSETRTALLDEVEEVLPRLIYDGLFANAQRIDVFGEFADLANPDPETIDLVVFTRGALPSQRQNPARYGRLHLSFIDLTSVHAERDVQAWLGRLMVFLGVEDFAPYTVWRKGASVDGF